MSFDAVKARQVSYVFMRWRVNLRNVFTLAHEFGLPGHGVLAAGRQTVSNPDFLGDLLNSVEGWPLFFVEAPSTINEVLFGQGTPQLT